MNDALIGNLVQTLCIVIEIYMWIIVISALMSWFRPNPYNQFVQLINNLTVPAFNFVRRIIPTTFGMMDLAPMILLLALMILRKLLLQLINVY